MSDARPVILCADDYGLTAGVSRGIADLLAAGRLSATSCMSVASAWPAAAGDLAGLSGRADIGLHLTLTRLAPLGPMPRLAPDGRLPDIGTLMRAAMARRLDEPEIAAELERQLDPRRLYVRSCAEGLPAILGRRVAAPKALLLSVLSRGLVRRCAAAGIATNRGFAGVNGFRPDEDFGAIFRRFLMYPGPLPLVMCHPGIPDAGLGELDEVTDRRRDELDYFAGDRFPADLSEAGCRLARFRR
jgi:predicted glycoside hydrolase/deacetylase ChbG (UPF0249 family)